MASISTMGCRNTLQDKSFEAMILQLGLPLQFLAVSAGAFRQFEENMVVQPEIYWQKTFEIFAGTQKHLGVRFGNLLS
jgi:hypothetical protein